MNQRSFECRRPASVLHRGTGTMAAPSREEFGSLQEMKRIKSAHNAEPLAQCLGHGGLQMLTVSMPCARLCVREVEGVGESTHIQLTMPGRVLSDWRSYHL